MENKKKVKKEKEVHSKDVGHESEGVAVHDFSDFNPTNDQKLIIKKYNKKSFVGSGKRILRGKVRI